MTFHAAHYYDDYNLQDTVLKSIFTNVSLLNQIASTTLKIEDYGYPCGWKTDGTYSDHNNYDVVTLLANACKVEGMALHTEAKAAVERLVDWCLSNSLKGDDIVVRDTTPVEAWYYAIRFLEIAGFWDPTTAPWGRLRGSLDSLGLKNLAQRLLGKFIANDDIDRDSNYAHDVEAILIAAKNGTRLPKAGERQCGR
jgi:hypothetical protein